MQDALSILKKYWGHQSFRPLQQEIIEAICAGHDTLALLPTGGGKSVCFQVPAMLLDGICLVVSPLIALMKDQVNNLEKRGIPALTVYSGMHFLEVKKTLQNAAYGNYKFLYLSPERLETSLFQEYLPAIKPAMVVIDEAHGVSQWGYDFRPPYLRIANLREQLPGVPFVALTASATPEIQDDICNKLAFDKTHKKFQQSFVRHTLSYSVFSPEAKQQKLLEVLQKVKGAAIVYCKSRKGTQTLARLLQMHQLKADYYHAGLTNSERSDKQDRWIKNEVPIIVCTNAFGMGIDKPDVRTVIHYDIPESLENYYQEAGRAGRDGHRAYAVLLYDANEIEGLKAKVAMRFPPFAAIKEMYIHIMNYLQVAAGGGEGEHFNFDIAVFASRFKVNILQATYTLQALSQEGLIQYDELFFKPSTLEFVVSKAELVSFEEDYPMLKELTQALLRSYEGIFDFPCTIYESLLALFIKKPIDMVNMQLRQLQQFGIVHYIPAFEKQQITLLKSRMYADAFTIDVKKLQQRKVHFEDRVKAITQYVSEKSACRNTFIAQYFGDTLAKRCGICDNCINFLAGQRKQTTVGTLAAEILTALTHVNVHVNDLLGRYKKTETEKVWEALAFLQAEEQILVTNDVVTKRIK